MLHRLGYAQAVCVAVVDNSYSNLYCFCSPISFSGCLQAKFERYEPAIAESFGLEGSLNTSCKKHTIITFEVELCKELSVDLPNNIINHLTCDIGLLMNLSPIFTPVLVCFSLCKLQWRIFCFLAHVYQASCSLCLSGIWCWEGGSQWVLRAFLQVSCLRLNQNSKAVEKMSWNSLWKLAS